MKRLPLVFLSSLAVLGAACSSTSSGIADPSLAEEAEARDRAAAETEARLFAPERLLTDLDKSIDKYAQYRMSGGSIRTDTTAEKIESFIHQQVDRNFDMLVREADSVDYPRNRAIAVAALGFSGREEALNPLVNAAHDENHEVVANAMFGLAMLGDQRTPPAVIARVAQSEDYDTSIRAGAGWALFELQQVVADESEILEIWHEILEGPIDEDPPGVVVSAVRGLGYSRESEHFDAIARYVSHPVPLVRTAVAIALGRLGDDEAVPSLLALIGPAETNENVKLAARKALQALAGGVDRGYDVEEWKRVFERSS